MTQTQQKFLISIIAVLLIAGLIISLNVDDQGARSGVSVITPSNTNISVDSRSQLTPSNTINTQNNNKQTQNPFSPTNNSNQANSATANNDPRLPPGFPELLPPLDKNELKQTDELIAEADAIVAKMDVLIAGLDLPVVQLTQEQQQALDKQQTIQQQKIDNIKQQLEALRQDL